MAKLLLEHGLDPNLPDRSRATILWLCAKDDMINFIDLLISYKADPNAKIPKASGHDMTILQWTARKGSLKAFQSLIGARKLVEQKSINWLRCDEKEGVNVKAGNNFGVVQEMQLLVKGKNYKFFRYIFSIHKLMILIKTGCSRVLIRIFLSCVFEVYFLFEKLALILLLLMIIGKQTELQNFIYF